MSGRRALDAAARGAWRARRALDVAEVGVGTAWRWRSPLVSVRGAPGAPKGAFAGEYAYPSPAKGTFAGRCTEFGPERAPIRPGAARHDAGPPARPPRCRPPARRFGPARGLFAAPPGPATRASAGKCTFESPADGTFAGRCTEFGLARSPV